eukprot:2116311-Alexandrium_andersonii.AAC.1
MPAIIPERPSQKKPENVCPFLVRGEQRADPNCRAGKDHDAEAVRVAAAWRDFGKQCLDFEATTGAPVA